MFCEGFIKRQNSNRTKDGFFVERRRYRETRKEKESILERHLLVTEVLFYIGEVVSFVWGDSGLGVSVVESKYK